MPDAAPHSTIDLLATARALRCLPTLLLLSAGGAAGWGAAVAGGARHEASLSWSLPALTCPSIAGATATREFDRFSLPATAIEGLGVRPAKVPSRIDGSLLRCAVDEQSGEATLRCAVEADDPAEALRLAELAEARVRERHSPLARAVAEARIFGACGRSWVQAQGREPVGEAAVHAALPEAPQLRALRERISSPAASLAPIAQGAPRPRPRAATAALGLLAGLFAALLLAAWRSRRSGAPAEPPRPDSRLATAALAGLLLTPSMDQVLSWDLGPFSLRFGQLCALVLLGALVAPRLRGGGRLVFPARSVLAALLYLSVAALSALWSGNPVKSAGYLAWAGLDLVAVLGGLALYSDTERRFERALKLWFAGLGLAAAMGALQLGLWAATGGAPLLCEDGHGFPRLNGFSYEPSYYALYLVPGALVLLTRFALLGRRAWPAALLAGVLLLAVGASTSRSGWLGVAFGVGLITALALRRLGRRALPRLLAAAGAAALAGALVLACWPQMRASAGRFARMAMDRDEVSSSRPRLDSMLQAARLVERHPLLGVGFGGYGAFLERHPELQRLEAKDAHAAVTTNLWLEIAAESGALGLLAALAMLGALLWPLGLRRRPAAGEDAGHPASAAREGLLAAALTTFLVLFQFSQTLWRLDIWVLLGLCFAAVLLSGRHNEKLPQQAQGGAGAPPAAPGDSERPTDRHAHRP